MSKQIASLFANIGADTTSLEKGLGKTKKELKRSEGAMNALKVMSVASWMQIGQAAANAAGQVYKFAETGAQFGRLEQAGRSLAINYGMDMDTILSKTKAATSGAVSEMDLLAAANKAMMLGVVQDSDQMAGIFTAAGARAKAMGITTTQAVNDIVTGIGRMSPMILDNLGIVTGGAKAFDEYAKSIGITAAELTDAQKKQFLVNKVMASSADLLDENGRLIDDVATSYEQLAAASADAGNRLRVEFGEAIAPIVDHLADALGASNDLARAMDVLGLSQYQAGVYIDGAGKMIAMSTDEVLAMADAQEIMAARAAASRDPLGVLAADVAELGAAAETAKEATVGLFDSIDSGLSARISGWIGDLDLLQAGILPIDEMAEQVRAGVEAKTITPAQGEAFFKELFVAMQNVEVEAGKIDVTQAGKNIADQLGIPLQEALDLLEEIKTKGLFDLKSRISVTFAYTTSGAMPGGPRLTRRATGGPVGPVTMVGEQGPEMIINGVVVPASETKKLMRLGLEPDQMRAMGGRMLDPGNDGSGSSGTGYNIGVVHGPTIGYGGWAGGAPTGGSWARGTPGPGMGGGGGGGGGRLRTPVESQIETTQAAQEAALTVIAPAISQQSSLLKQSQNRQIVEAAKSAYLLGEIRDMLANQPVELGDAVADALAVVEIG